MRETYKDGDGVTWRYDDNQAQKLIKSYAMTRAIHENTSAVATREGWLQKLRLLPPTGELSQDWQAVSAQRDRILADAYKTVGQRAQGGWDDYQSYLIALRTLTDQYRRAYQGTLASVQDMNSALISAAETGVTAAKFTRDASVVGIAVIATVATGGATSVMAYGLGTAGSAGATYQDTKSVGKAALSGALFLVPAGMKQITIAGSAAGASKTVIASFSLAVEMSADVVSGVAINNDTFGTALRNAGINAAIGQAADPLAGWLGSSFRDAVKVMDTHGGQQSNRVWSAAGHAGAKAASAVVTSTSSTLLDTKPSVSSEAAFGVAAGKSGPVPFAYKPNTPLMCMAPPVQTDSEAARFVKQNVLTRA